MRKVLRDEAELNRHPLVGEIARFMDSESMAPPKGKLLVGVSGGIDSMALLEVLRILAPAYGWKLTVAHFNHKLRGSSSEADQRLVVRTTREAGLPVVTGSGSVRDYARRLGISIEMAARVLRHRFLAATARRRGIRTVALAHHARDQVELFFLRLMRGAAPEGLAGMRPASASPADARVRLVRPFLRTPREAIERFCADRGVRFREDTSNEDEAILRNRIRRELLPLLQTYHPGLETNVARLMEIARAESDYVARRTKEWLSRPHAKFQDANVAVQRRIIAERLISLGVSYDFDLIERLRTCPGKAVNGPGGSRLVLDAASGLVAKSTKSPTAFRKGHEVVKIEGPAGKVRFADVDFSWQVVSGREMNKRPRGCEVFDAASVGSSIRLRHWQPGDRFQPIGMEKPVKLQDFLTNLKIPRADRCKLVVAEDATGRIFWVEGCRISELHKVKSATKKGLRWAPDAGKPWVAGG